MRSALALSLLWGAVACGPGAQIGADPREIKANGSSSTTITFRDDRPDGSTVYFETDRGHFVEEGYEAQSITRNLSGGRVSVELFSSVFPGTATVVASTDYGDTTVTVEFVAMRPSGQNLNFECETVNIGALAEPIPDRATPCHLRVQDREGDMIDPRSLSGDDFGFIAEAGIMHPSIVDDGYGTVHFLYSAIGGAGRPQDVDPLPGEPSRSGDTGGTRNPRDGLVTIVVWVRGEEGFHDINNNGLFEPEAGETFSDVGEPFVDVDDDGVFDPGAGDTTIDLDEDGRYTGPNGSWDEEAVVWTSFKLLWTGQPHESPTTSRIEMHGGREIPVGTTRDVAVHVCDRNINPLASHGDDTITVYPDCYSCTYPDTNVFSLHNTRGFEVDDNGLILGNLFEPPNFILAITNTNSYPDPDPFTVTVYGETTPAPMTSDGEVLSSERFELDPFEGSLAGAPE